MSPRVYSLIRGDVFTWMKFTPGRRVTLPVELPWVSQLYIIFIYMAYFTLATGSRVTLFAR